MTGYEFGDVVLVPFPFTDHTTTKHRPAVIISSRTYHEHRPDVILMAITSQLKPPSALGDLPVSAWQEAGLLKPSVIKPVMTTVDARLVIKKLGRLSAADCTTLKQVLRELLG